MQPIVLRFIFGFNFFTSTSLSFQSLSTTMPSLLFSLRFPVYQSLNPDGPNSLPFSLTHLDCRWYIMLILFGIMVPTNFIKFPVKEPIFQVAKTPELASLSTCVYVQENTTILPYLTLYMDTDAGTLDHLALSSSHIACYFTR